MKKQTKLSRGDIAVDRAEALLRLLSPAGDYGGALANNQRPGYAGYDDAVRNLVRAAIAYARTIKSK